MGAARQSEQRPAWAGLAVGLGTLAAAALILALVEPLRHAVSLAFQGDLEGLHHHFDMLGAGGVALLLGLMLVHAVIIYPTEIVTATAGLVYGFLPGLALSLGGWLASAMLTYLLGRTIGEPLALWIFGERRYRSLEQAVERGGVTLLLAVRLIPIVPFSLAGYVAGATEVPVWRFAWTTVVGYLPLCAICAYLGSESRTLSVGDPRLWAGLGALLAMVVAAHRLRLSHDARAREAAAELPAAAEAAAGAPASGEV